MVDQQRLQTALHMFASTLVRRYEVAVPPGRLRVVRVGLDCSRCGTL